ncbi:hypothetical protein LZ32DRAFT_600724 [Colletotrichum eremochloae]|nr:hypothetical protein LZ32DRAFT_600724 [Colletotrichum eremochloae]
MALIIKALTIALVISTTEACSSYRQCRCTMANGAINNTITAMAAQKLIDKKEYSDEDTSFPISQDGQWIQTGKDMRKCKIYLDNCDVREACTAAGATGADS